MRPLAPLRRSITSLTTALGKPNRGVIFPALAAMACCALTLGSSAVPAGRAVARGQPPLPVSSASGRVVQPQPPPGSCRARGSGRFSLPDRRCTPGAISPAVTQGNLRSTICRSGYTKGVRPPAAVTDREKRASMAAYGDRGSARGFEYDHLVPLELGGAVNDPRNLWPEPGAVPNPKDRLEGRLHSLVCAGQLSLSAAQREIAGDWVATYRQLIG